MQAETAIDPLTAFIPLLLLLLGLAVLVYLVIEIGRSRRAATVAAVVVGGFLLSCGVAALMYFISQDAHFEQAQVETRRAIRTDIEASVARSVQTWTKADAQLFTADIYPGLQQAVQPLARKVREFAHADPHLSARSASSETTIESDQPADTEVDAQSADQSTPAEMPGEPLHTIRLFGHALPQRHRERVLSDFGKYLRDQFPNAVVSKVAVAANYAAGPEAVEDPIKVDEGAIHLVLSLSNESSQTAPWDSDAVEVSGQLNCTIKTPRQSTQVSCSYIEKPWVHGFDAFVSAHPQSQLVVGYSGEFVSSEAEARRLAMNNAQAKSRRVVGNMVVMPDESQLMDRFAQRLSRPYGDVWREAVLLNVSSERMAPLVATARQQAAVVQRRKSSTVVGLLMLFAVAAGMCVTLNVLTKGYYRGRVVVGGVLVGVIVVLVFGLVLVRVSHVEPIPAIERPTQYEGAEEAPSEVSRITDHEISEPIRSGDAENVQSEDTDSIKSGETEAIQSGDSERTGSQEPASDPSVTSDNLQKV